MNRRFIIRMRPTTYHRAKRCGDTRECVCIEFVMMYNLFDTVYGFAITRMIINIIGGTQCL